MQIVAKTLMRASGRLAAAPLFHAGRTITVDDAIASALFRGELAGAIRETLELAASEERAADDVDISDASLQAAAESFRYEHELISAGETEAWLAERGLTTDDFSRWLYQRLCREAMKGSLAEPFDVPDEFGDLLRIHLWFSGGMDAIAEQLKRRVAANREVAADAARAADAIAAFMQRESLDRDALRAWVEDAGRDAAWLDEMARMEAAFARVASKTLTADARSRKLAAMQRSLSRVEFDLFDVDSQGAAREAYLCVRDDRIPLAEVAREAGYAVQRQERSIEDLGAVAERLFSAAEGDVVGPLETEGRFRLYQVLRKKQPSLADAAVARRIDDLLLDELFVDLTARHVEPARTSSAS
ncbi:MAG TPA: hypothetical protein VFV54_06125 [Thermoanaerobaculia bacterium]|nr:hypothetical protein [Thermoanaerobaculia bacterium]